MFQLVGSGIDLGDDDAFVVLVLLAELIIDGRQLFAVSAPVSTKGI